MLRDLVEAGYEPNKSYEAGTRTQITLRFEKMSYIRGTQNVVRPAYTEASESNVKPLFNVYKVLIETLPIFYTDIDIQVLHEYRTIIPSDELEDGFKKSEFHEKKLTK